jgi:hypothetical protein
MDMISLRGGTQWGGLNGRLDLGCQHCLLKGPAVCDVPYDAERSECCVVRAHGVQKKPGTHCTDAYAVLWHRPTSDETHETQRPMFGVQQLKGF